LPQPWRNVLGFKEFWRGGANPKQLSWIDMRVPDGQDYVEFMLYRTLPPPDKWGAKNHVSLAVPNVAKAVEILESRSAFKTYGRPLTVAIGVNKQRQVNLYDPDGTRIELMEPFTVSGKPAHPPPPPAATFGHADSI
jgi:lactoylglutathione lyase